MRVSSKHPVKFGDVLCNTTTGKFYSAAAAAKTMNGRRTRLITFIEVNAGHDCLQEHPISFDKDTVGKMVFVNNNEEKLLVHIEARGYNFNTMEVSDYKFVCYKR